jgi:large subunit ribosomal protein L4
MNIPVYDIKGKAVTPWKIEDKSLGKVSPVLLAQAIRVYMSNTHQKTHKVLTRGEVQGSTKKIYRQKGTGKARHGAKYAPIFVGGGIAHGPTGVRPQNLVLPKAMRRRALMTAFAAKLTAKAISGLTGVKTFSGKTSNVVKLLGAIADHPKNSVLIVTSGKATPLYQAASNVQGVAMKRACLVNAYDLVASDYLILTKKALEIIRERSI